MEDDLELNRTENETTEEGASTIFHPTRNLITLENRKKSVEALSISLGSLSDLYSILKTAHWNIKGAFFISLHTLFDELAEGVLNYVDQFAERITALGGTADGRLIPSSKASILIEFQLNPFDAYSYLDQLSVYFAQLSQHLQEKSKELMLSDPTTSNFYLEVAMQIDKDLYFLESHLQLN